MPLHRGIVKKDVSSRERWCKEDGGKKFHTCSWLSSWVLAINNRGFINYRHSSLGRGDTSIEKTNHSSYFKCKSYFSEHHKDIAINIPNVSLIQVNWSQLKIFDWIFAYRFLFLIGGQTPMLPIIKFFYL